MHDSSACIARGGELLFAVAEERISRIKHDAGFPRHAIRACLEFAKVSPDQIDFICQGWPAPRSVFAADLKCFLRGQYPATYLNMLNSARLFASMSHQNGGFRSFTNHFGQTRAQMRFVDHHLAHAVSAYSYSGFDNAAVVVMDGRGAWEASSIWYGHGGRLDHVLTIPWPNSLGLFYAQFTQYLGFLPNSDEWKVMGLAPYGNPGVKLNEFISLNHESYRVNAPLLLQRSNGTSAIAKRLGPERAPESEVDESFKNVAFAVQDACEVAMLALVKLATQKTNCRNVCLAGGVALNSKANGKIQASGMVDNLFIQPAASDDGVALGAVLAAGKIIGWFQGRMEFGPRALGGRSILADPRDPEMNAKVNKAVKFREWWRPFAPSMLREVAGEYLERAFDSPFMILTNPVRPEKRGIIPSVTHVDGSARPQTVEKDTNPLYWNLINEFGKRSGVPVLMNTSFNLRGEAIVNTPTDAVRTFFSSGMVAMVIGSYLVEK